VGNNAFIFGNTYHDVGPHNYLTLDLETLESSPPLLNELELFDAGPAVVATKRDSRKQVYSFPECIGHNLTYFMIPYWLLCMWSHKIEFISLGELLTFWLSCRIFGTLIWIFWMIFLILLCYFFSMLLLLWIWLNNNKVPKGIPMQLKL